jgi:LuxR family maltose regulon positive regulatory protein
VTTSLLKTKLYAPPIRSGLVSRPRLIERLNAGLVHRRKLTLISAPAGFGKTTLLSEWLAGCEQPAAWLSLDEEDDDLARFLAYLVGALQMIPDLNEAGVGESALATLHASQPQPLPVEAILTTLINKITTISTAFILVLDDYHLIQAQPIHDALAFLLDHLPPSMHLALATRADPPLPVARLRGQGQLTELRQTDLRFTIEETTEFLNTRVGLSLSAEDIAALESRTEGWIVGLQLAALSLQDRADTHEFITAFTGEHHYVLEYLIEEVVRRQPEPVQRFLMQTSILDRLCGPLCNALTDESDGEAMLAHLRQRNLFILPLDDEHHWYRYHHLFTDLLGNLLRKKRSPEYIQGLHLRACEWYEENGLIPEAVNHALAAADFQQASELIERTAWGMLMRGEVRAVLRWLHALPDAEVRSRSELVILYAWGLALTGQLDDADSCLACVNDRYGQGEVAAVRGYIAHHRRKPVEAIEYCQKALRLLPKEQWFPRGVTAVILGTTHLRIGDPLAASQALAKAVGFGQTVSRTYLTMIAMTGLGEAQEMQGLLRQAVQTFQEALELASEYATEPVPFTGMAYIGLAGPLYERNDLDQAMHCVTKGIELSKQARSIDTIEDGYFNLALLHQALGDPDGALEAIREVEDLAQKGGDSYWMARACAFRSQRWLEQRNIAVASHCAQESRLCARDDADFVREFGEIAMARVLVARALSRGTTQSDEASQALRSLAGLLQTAEAAMRMGSIVKILALQALAFQAQRDMDQAMSALERALSLAEPEGFVRTFVDEGEPMARLLQQAAARGIAPDYGSQLLAVFGAEEIAFAAAAPGAASLVEPLTERELEVLHLLGDGYSNQDIAGALVITLNTVKKHASGIYGKLGVHNRTQAVIRAQELGLL